MHYMYTNNYTAELRRSFAKALVRHNGLKNAVPSSLKVGCFLRRTARCVALRKLPNVARKPVQNLVFVILRIQSMKP